MVNFMIKLVFISSTILLVASSCRYLSSDTSPGGEEITQEVISGAIQNYPIAPPATTEILLDTIRWNTVKLEGHHIIIEDEFIDMKGSFMAKKNNLIFFRNALYRNWDYYYLAYSVPDFKLVKKFGTLGGGPEEFGSPRFFIDEKDTANIGSIYDISYGDYYKVRNDLSLHKIAVYKDLCFKTLEPCFYTDTTAFYLTGFDTKGAFLCKYNTNAGFPGEQLYDLKLKPTIDFSYAYTGDYAFSIKQNRLIYAYKFFREIHILDTNGTLLRTLKGKGGNDTKTSNDYSAWMDNLSNPTYYCDIFCQSDRYVYFVNSNGRTINDWLTNKPPMNTIIEQYDWNGTPIRRIELDKRTTTSVWVDEKENRIYLLASDEDDPIYVYDLPEAGI